VWRGSDISLRFLLPFDRTPILSIDFSIEGGKNDFDLVSARFLVGVIKLDLNSVSPLTYSSPDILVRNVSSVIETLRFLFDCSSIDRGRPVMRLRKLSILTLLC
jgi:hypothetical protein